MVSDPSKYSNAVNARGYNTDKLITNPATGDVFGVQSQDGDLEGWIYKRTPAGVLTSLKLSTIPGNPLGYPTDVSHGTARPYPGLDNHLGNNIGVDNTGRIHVSGQYHNEPISLIRSNNPWDISTWTNHSFDPDLTLINRESHYDFDRFVFTGFKPASNGDLYMFTHPGANGNYSVSTGVYKWSTGTSLWTRVQQTITNGTVGVEPVRAYDFFGGFEIFNDVLYGVGNWCPASTLPYDRKAPLIWIKSTDGGVTWTNRAGTVLTLPLTRANSGAAATGIDPSGVDGYNNVGYPYIDTAGRETFVVNFLDGSIFRCWWNGSAWTYVNAVTLQPALQEFVDFQARVGLLKWHGQDWWCGGIGHRQTMISQQTGQIIRLGTACDVDWDMVVDRYRLAKDDVCQFICINEMDEWDICSVGNGPKVL